MRKYQKKQLLGLIDTLQEAHNEIKKLLVNDNVRAASKLLADCQNCAVHLGNTIEQLEGEGTNAVSLLEDYCESLYRLSITAGDSDEFDRIFCNLNNQLNHVGNSVAEFKSDKIEAVFLPYKASMWDSMESVWLAAKADPQCDAYVIPIPYFDRRSDGALGETHYESNQFPEYVPITDWQNYSLKDRHPDIIFIHNPYDGGNYVTSVHPDFYSEKIKDFTEMLVYIPYFVCIDNVPESFCVSAGTIFADRVIVQSDRIRNKYISEFRKFEKSNNSLGAFGKTTEKFAALGSPKFDKVINTKKEDCEIPSEWLKLIEKPDGSRKKVILYNTNVSGLLEGNEKVLDKLKYSFNCFKENDNIVVLWRPHPLSLSTYASMRPALLNSYLNIIEKYRREGFGIYDDTADLNRAIAVSDAYYGDWSSLVALYQITGKPIMIEDISCSQDNERPLCSAFECMYDDGSFIWFPAYNFNALFKMDKSTWKAEYMGSFPSEARNGLRLYHSVAACGDKLFFAPESAEEIAEYDISNHNFKKITFDLNPVKERVAYNPGDKFCSAVSYRHWIFFIPASYPAIVRYDCITGKLDYFKDWIEPLNRLIIDPHEIYFNQACVSGSCIVMASYNANAAVKFDMDNCTSRVYKVGEYCYCGICFDGENFWMPPRHQGPVVKWNAETGTCKEYDNFPDGFLRKDFSFQNISCANGYVWLFPNSSNMALKVNVCDGSITIAEEFQEECELQSSEPDFLPAKYLLSCSAENILYAHTGKSNRFLKYDCVTKSLQKINVLFADGDFSLLYSSFINNDCQNDTDCNLYEGKPLTLHDFIEYTLKRGSQPDRLSESMKKLSRKNMNYPDGTSGTAIYQYCKETIISKQQV